MLKYSKIAVCNVLLHISHAKTFKMMYTRCQFNNPIQKYSQLQFMCGSNFYETDVTSIVSFDWIWKRRLQSTVHPVRK